MTFNENDVAKYFELSQKIKDLEEEKARLNKIIKEEALGKYKVSEFAVDLLEVNNGINKPLFIRDFPQDEFPELYELVPSTEQIKRYLGKEEIDDYSNKTVRLTISRFKR